ncbi:sulfatase-like hydrolase/transferase [Acidobacteriota bacterium]
MFLKNGNNSEFKKKIYTSLLVVSFLVLTAFVFGPSKIYFANTQEFSSSYSEILYFLIPAALLLILSITIIIIILPVKYPIYQKIIALLFGLSFLLWFQGNILVWNYGPFDGRAIIWNNYFFNGIIDNGIWIVFIIMLFAKSKILYNFIPKICVVFILIQLLSTSIDFIQNPKIEGLKEFYINKENIYTFSREKNVVLLVFDAFQSDVFNEIINEDKKIKESFEGFTYFRNSLGGYPSTFASIPLILTGLYYNNSTPVPDFQKKAYLSPSSLPKTLKENNFNVDIFTFAKKTLYYDKKVASNFSRKNRNHMIYLSETLQIVDISLFRYIPHFLKKYIYNDNRWFLKNLAPKSKPNIYLPFKNSYDAPKYKKFRKAISNLKFIKEMNSQFNLSSKKFTFKFYHLWGVHPALELNENLEYEAMPLTRINYKKQSKAILKIIKQFLNILKKKGIYNQTMILIAGDHGCPFARIGLKLPEEISEGNKPVNMEIIGKAIPLVLIKPFDISGEMKISDAPVTLGDIPATAFRELGISGDFPGISMFEIEKEELRNRKFYYYSLNRKRKKSINGEFLLPMKEFIISGFSWNNSSWEFSNKIFTHEGVKSPKNYKVNDTIKFGRDGNADQYLIKGWSYRDRKFYWTNGKKAEMKIPMNQPKTDLLLKARLSPFILPGKLDFQRVNIYVNDFKIGKWRLEKAGEYQMVIKRGLFKDNFVKLTFELPDATSPMSLNHREDIRVLRVKVKQVKLVKIL